jgi:hypothetical protein
MKRNGMLVGVVGTLALALGLVAARLVQAQNRRPYFPGANSYGRVFHPDHVASPSPTPRVVPLTAPLTVVDGKQYILVQVLETQESELKKLTATAAAVVAHTDRPKLGTVRLLVLMERGIVATPDKVAADSPGTGVPAAATASR